MKCHTAGHVDVVAVVLAAVRSDALGHGLDVHVMDQSYEKDVND